MKWLLLMMLLYCPLVSGEVYKWTDAQGNVHYGDCERENCPTGQQQRKTMVMDNEGVTIIKSSPVRAETNAVSSESPAMTPKTQVRAVAKDAFEFVCYTSPSKYIGDAYDEFSDLVKVREFNKEELITAQSLITLERGQWSLSLVETRCKGQRERTTTFSRTLVSTVDVKTSKDGFIILQTEEFSDESKTRSFAPQTRWWGINAQGLWFGDKQTNNYSSLQWQAEVIAISNDEFRFLKRSRIGDKAKRRYMALYSIRKRERWISIEELVFIDNILSDKTQWIMTK